MGNASPESREGQTAVQKYMEPAAHSSAERLGLLLVQVGHWLVVLLAVRLALQLEEGVAKLKKRDIIVWLGIVAVIALFERAASSVSWMQIARDAIIIASITVMLVVAVRRKKSTAGRGSL